MVTLPKKYAYLATEGAPNILLQALAKFGTREIVGPGSSSQILGWAKEVGLSRDYTADETPWCGLFVAVCAHDANYPPARIALRAKDWLNWGKPVPTPMLGDVVVFDRDGGGHVGIYVGEDTAGYLHILGGNQGNCVCIARFPSSRMVGARRSPFKIGQPANVRRIWLGADGPISHTEA